MAVKRGICIIAILAMALGLSGCVDAMPDLSDEESDIIAEYCATILLKHSNGYNYRLVDQEALEKSIFEDNQALQAAIDEAEKEKMEEAASANNENGDSTENGNSEDSNSENNSEVVSEETIEDTVEISYASETNIAECIGVESTYEINYLYYETAQNYPSELSESGFQVSSTKDNTLLVVHFNVTNVSGETVHCDMMDINPRIKIKYNGTGYKSIEKTLLVNDFTTFIGDIEAGASEELVAIVEVPIQETQSILMQITDGNEKKELVVD